jgi:hypothetical protein
MEQLQQPVLHRSMVLEQLRSLVQLRSRLAQEQLRSKVLELVLLRSRLAQVQLRSKELVLARSKLALARSSLKRALPSTSRTDHHHKHA